MTTEEIKAINTERLGRWADTLAENHATPAVLIGVSHDHNSGQVHLCIPENLPDEMGAAVSLGCAATTQQMKTFGASRGTTGKQDVAFKIRTLSSRLHATLHGPGPHGRVAGGAIFET